jgi:hypothetical protein
LTTSRIARDIVGRQESGTIIDGRVRLSGLAAGTGHARGLLRVREGCSRVLLNVSDMMGFVCQIGLCLSTLNMLQVRGRCTKGGIVEGGRDSGPNEGAMAGQFVRRVHSMSPERLGTGRTPGPNGVSASGRGGCRESRNPMPTREGGPCAFFVCLIHTILQLSRTATSVWGQEKCVYAHQSQQGAHQDWQCGTQPKPIPAKKKGELILGIDISTPHF